MGCIRSSKPWKIKKYQDFQWKLILSFRHYLNSCKDNLVLIHNIMSLTLFFIPFFLGGTPSTMDHAFFPRNVEFFSTNPQGKIFSGMVIKGGTPSTNPQGNFFQKWWLRGVPPPLIHKEFFSEMLIKGGTPSTDQPCKKIRNVNSRTSNA